MPAKHALKLCLLLCLIVGSLLACDILPNISGDSSSTATPVTGTVSSFNVWYTAATGIEVRKEDWKTATLHEDTVMIVRLDLKRVHLSIGYQPTDPLSMSDWMKKTGALAMINGGYFDAQNNPTALLISHGQVAGTSYDGFGGMLSVDSQGTVNLHSLRTQPYDPAAQLQEATQSSPMLVVDGQRTQFTANVNNQRRSVVATDKQGRLLLIASSSPAFSLDDMADLLAKSDLSLQDALNLDGGSSTGLYVAGNPQVDIDPLLLIPIVIIVK